MNADLERTLDELGPEYRAVVSRLKAGREARRPTSGVRAPTFDARRPAARPAGFLVAAAFAVALTFAFLFQDAARPRRSPYAGARIYTVAYAPTEEALEQIVASQHADGSWSNDFITQQNAAALRASDDARMRVAYRRAVRYLRSKGLAPLTDDELKARAAHAAHVLADA